MISIKGFIRKSSPILCLVISATLGLNSAFADDKKHSGKKYRGLIGADSKKIKIEGDKTFIWAGGDKDPKSSESQWYDFTGSLIPAGELQFGIGKDRIRAIDDPMFVYPDDPRLKKLPVSPYRRDEKPKTNKDLMVIGYAENGIARAYPTTLLDHHEFVNDDFNGKPVTVGW